MAGRISVWLGILAVIAGAIYTFNERSYYPYDKGIIVAGNLEKTTEAFDDVIKKLKSLDKRTDKLERQKLLDEIERLKNEKKERQVPTGGRR